MPKKVVILGGGVAGLSAAHELIERGFDVDVYEKKPTYLGGKARSVNVPGSELPKAGGGQHAPLPGEHGFRFFPGFYRHITDTMKRIPFTDATGRKNPNGVYDNLVDVQRVGILRNGKPPIITVVSFPKSLADLEAALSVLHTHDTGLLPGEARFFASKVWQLMTSCQRRRELDYEKIGWWQFMEASSHSKPYQHLLVEGLTRTLVAANAKHASTKTGGDIFIQLLFNIANPGMHTDRVLNGPTTDVWLKPWEEYLSGKGVRFFRGALVEKLVVADGRIEAVTIRDWQKAQAASSLAPGSAATTANAFNYDPPALGDFYLLATPVEVTTTLFEHSVKKNSGSLKPLDELASNVAWMNGIQFYLNQEIDIVQGHCIYVDSEWALTSISQLPFWSGYRMDERGDGTVKTIFSVDISDWNTLSSKNDPDLKPMKAKDCQTFDEIADRVWAQLKRSLNVNGTVVLSDDMRQGVYNDHGQAYKGYYLDHSINMQAPPGAADPAASAVGEAMADLKAVNHEPLLVNTVDSWGLRPDAYVGGISNLFLASDYVRTNTDLATMEGANEAARRAVNCIIDAAKVNAEPCQIWNLHEPAFFVPHKWYDAYRYQRGLPYGHPPGWLKALFLAWGIVYGVGFALMIAFYWVQDKLSRRPETIVANRSVTAPPAVHGGEVGRAHALRVPFMLGMMTLGVGLLILDSHLNLGWHTAAVWGYGLTALYAAYVLLSRDTVVGAILAFALVAGFAELASDYYLVSITDTLIYPRPEPRLWDSPAYMPFSWTVVLTQIGFIGYLIMKRLSPLQTGLLLVPISGILIPLYENWAIQGGWWNYVNAPEWHGVPYYIYLAEALLVFPVPYFIRKATVAGGRWALIGGLLEGLVMLVACLVAFKLVG
ncbi:hydroxysqualene dehydroxylase [Fibrella forsythiae]|uniref:NAD(P)-binding protein n=1 Tax=Fibrella forsythiae TaxID=2817061 RepID=A0ABS3JGE2_9BACT|nr:FAD-dependent oxidoreductase [Fibrella forsythiae]MBO0947957.1 NAD(P)-binding protein [Fibrella forsythiae]